MSRACRDRHAGRRAAAEDVRGGGLLGARVIVTGVSGELAAALVALGVDFRGLDSYADLQSGVESARGQAWS